MQNEKAHTASHINTEQKTLKGLRRCAAPLAAHPK